MDHHHSLTLGRGFLPQAKPEGCGWGVERKGVYTPGLRLSSARAKSTQAFLALQLEARPLTSVKGDPGQWGHNIGCYSLPCLRPVLWGWTYSACPNPGGLFPSCCLLLHPLLTEGGPGTPQQTDFEVLTWAHLEAGRTSQWASNALPAPPPPWMQFQGPGKNSSTIPETRPGLHSLHV